ncbi:Transposon resolvase [Bacillus thuringiensis serovar andalousiensis BGSC 4AW1]|nr:Transposon resolvase [Bacillus thuringiensis serovar andalousiensis BGSC 4AW1]
MIYGYARVSAQDQNLDTRIEQLLKYGVDKIVKEKIRGVSQEKIELDDLLSRLIKGDTLVVTRMDRLGRIQFNYYNLLNIFVKRSTLCGFKFRN